MYLLHDHIVVINLHDDIADEECRLDGFLLGHSTSDEDCADDHGYDDDNEVKLTVDHKNMMDDAHSHVHVLDGVHDVDPQHEVGDQPKEDEHCHMHSSQTSPMGSFPENCLPANVVLNFLFLCELLTLRLTFWKDLHQAHRHI